MAEESDKKWAPGAVSDDPFTDQEARQRRSAGRQFDYFGDEAIAEPGAGRDAAGEGSGDALFDALNDSLDDVIVLLEREIERLKSSLAVYRDSEHPNRRDIMRMHVEALDRRQDTLDEMRDLLKQTG
ncbi:MAG: hypothetical protein NXH85_06740 [Pseudomonadaceae bacterium]|nr:hypothetical protein [Pseudomonadaceae bacterium]